LCIHDDVRDDGPHHGSHDDGAHGRLHDGDDAHGRLRDGAHGRLRDGRGDDAHHRLVSWRVSLQSRLTKNE
jgi:hypothetical protein